MCTHLPAADRKRFENPRNHCSEGFQVVFRPRGDPTGCLTWHENHEPAWLLMMGNILRHQSHWPCNAQGGTTRSRGGLNRRAFRWPRSFPGIPDRPQGAPSRLIDALKLTKVANAETIAPKGPERHFPGPFRLPAGRGSPEPALPEASRPDRVARRHTCRLPGRIRTGASARPNRHRASLSVSRTNGNRVDSHSFRPNQECTPDGLHRAKKRVHCGRQRRTGTPNNTTARGLVTEFGNRNGAGMYRAPKRFQAVLNFCELHNWSAQRPRASIPHQTMGPWLNANRMYPVPASTVCDIKAPMHQQICVTLPLIRVPIGPEHSPSLEGQMLQPCG